MFFPTRLRRRSAICFLSPGSCLSRKGIEELELKACTLTDDFVAIANFGKPYAIRNVRIAAFEELSENENEYLASMTQSHGALRMELESARAAIGLGERDIRNFSHTTWKWYSLLGHSQSTSFVTI